MERTECLILTLPSEVLDEICASLKDRDKVRVLKTCKRLFHISSRLLYRDIDVHARSARLLFCVLASPKSTIVNYGDHVKSLAFSVASNTDIYVSYPVLCKALGQLKRITSLRLFVPPKFSVFLIQQMKIHGIILSDDTPRLPAPVIQPLYASPRIFLPPHLHEIMIGGDLKFLEIARYRSMTAVNIIEPINYHGLAYVMEVLTCRGVGEPITIRRLGLSFDFPTESGVSYALEALATAFPELYELAFYTSHVNALHVTYMLAHRRVLFPNLKILSANYLLLRTPRYITAMERCIEIQRRHLNVAASQRSNFTEVNFGCTQWTRSGQHWSFNAGGQIDEDEWRYDDTDDDDDDFEEEQKKGFAPEVYFHDVPYSVTPPSGII